LEASRAAFTAVQQIHAGESFYAFGLFHDPLWADIIPASNSEEGLIRRAEEYRLDKYNLGYAQKSIEQLTRELRWSTGDWTYLDVQNGFFNPVNDWLREKEVYWMYKDDDAFRGQLNTNMISSCQTVLKTLDAAGLFGTGAAREQVVLNILMGDQDPSWYTYARILNPPAVYDRWVSEVEIW
jgi:hypothetical protein